MDYDSRRKNIHEISKDFSKIRVVVLRFVLENLRERIRRRGRERGSGRKTIDKFPAPPRHWLKHGRANQPRTTLR
jgi:hypothetical protein